MFPYSNTSAGEVFRIGQKNGFVAGIAFSIGAAILYKTGQIIICERSGYERKVTYTKK